MFAPELANNWNLTVSQGSAVSLILGHGVIMSSTSLRIGLAVGDFVGDCFRVLLFNVCMCEWSCDVCNYNIISMLAFVIDCPLPEITNTIIITILHICLCTEWTAQDIGREHNANCVLCFIFTAWSIRRMLHDVFAIIFCPSVRLSQAGNVSKQLNRSSLQQLSFSSPLH